MAPQAARDLWVDRPGVRIAVRDYRGVGPDVLLVHGSGTSLDSWAALAEVLTPHARVVAFDLRGHGHSSDAADTTWDADVGDACAIVDALGLERPVLVGSSHGAQVAQCYAANGYPASAIVLLDFLWGLSYKPQVPVDWVEFARELEHSSNWAFAPDESSYLRASLSSTLPALTPDQIETLIDRQFPFGPDGYRHRRPTLSQQLCMHKGWLVGRPDPADGYAGLYAAIRCPVLGVFGRTGIAANDEDRGFLTSLEHRWDNVEVTWIEGGHLLPTEAPAELYRVLLAFLSEEGLLAEGSA